MDKLQVVAAIIQNSEGRVLLAQRPPGKDLAGHWEFPGGKIEKGEKPDQALARELREELNLNVSIRSSLGQFEYRYGWGTVFMHVYLVVPLSAPEATKDVEKFEWVEIDDVADYPLAPADLRPWFFFLDQQAGLKT